MRGLPIHGLVTVTLAASLSCKKDPEPPLADPPAATKPEIAAKAEPAPPAPLPDEPAPARVQEQACDPQSARREDRPYDGEAIKALCWTDASGDNAVIFSRAGSPEEGRVRLWANHFATKDGATTLLRQVKELDDDCEYDMSTGFIGSAFAVRDLDADGIGEAQFAYRANTCRSDMSPVTVKLFLLENGDKYVVRGRSYWADIGDEAFGKPETPEPDPAFGKAPPSFLPALLELWPEVSREGE